TPRRRAGRAATRPRPPRRGARAARPGRSRGLQHGGGRASHRPILARRGRRAHMHGGRAGWLRVAARRASVAAEVVTVADVFPLVAQVVLATTDARALAEFYRALLGLEYRPGDEPPSPGDPDPAGQDWLVLRGGPGGVQLAFQQVGSLPPST